MFRTLNQLTNVSCHPTRGVNQKLEKFTYHQLNSKRMGLLSKEIFNHQFKAQLKRIRLFRVKIDLPYEYKNDHMERKLNMLTCNEKPTTTMPNSESKTIRIS